MWASRDALQSVLNEMNRNVYSIIPGHCTKRVALYPYIYIYIQWGDHSLSWNDTWEATEVASGEEVWVAWMGEPCMVCSFAPFGILNV